VKKVLALVKGNLVPVVCLLVIVVSLPVAWFFSSNMNASIREEVKKKADSAMTKIRGAQVAYTVPALHPDEAPLEERSAPNAEKTEFYRAQRERVLREHEAVVERAIEVNARGEREPIVENLFPDPGASEQILTAEMARKIVGDSNQPSVYEGLLSAIDAGGAPDEERIADVLTDVRDRRLEQMDLVDASTISAEDADIIREALIERRRAEYRRRANEISVYGTIEAIRGSDSGGPTTSSNEWSEIPTEIPASSPSVAECFIWQWDYWVISDVLAAIANANTVDGGLTPVPESAVKRLEWVKVEALPVLASDNNSGGGDFGGDFGGGGGDTGGGMDSGGLVPTDAKVSVTGRTSSLSNDLYDVRRVRMSVIVSSEQLPKLWDAFSRTNFMTVIGVQLEEIDPVAQLREGYDYGPSHVMRAQIDVETIWLRSWTTELMPPSIKRRLGVPEQEEPVGDDFGGQG